MKRKDLAAKLSQETTLSPFQHSGLEIVSDFLLAFLLLLCMCWTLGIGPAYAAPPAPIPDPLPGPTPMASGTNGIGFHPQRLLVKPRPEAFANPTALRAGMAGLHATLGTRSLRIFPQIGDLEVVEIPPAGLVQELLQQYRSSPLVEYAEPDYQYKAFVVPNDPDFPALWGLQNTGTNGGVAGADIHAPGAWDIRTTAGTVIVAITDTGIRLTHEDLAANLWTNLGEIPGNGVDDDGNGFVDDIHGMNVLAGSGNPADDAGHGTHVAGIIGAIGDNGKGVVGVAWRVQLMALKWLDSTGAGYASDVIQCLDYARAKGANIVNASWGGPYYSHALYDAIATLRARGIILVAAAGNDSMDNGQYFPYPASYPLDNIVAVAASERTDQLAAFSDYGATTVDLAAPGEEIRSTWFTGDSAYLSLSGTSMAAPHVCGALALLQAQLPAENYLARIYRLYAAVDPVPGLAGKCRTGGRLNLQRALASTLETTPPNSFFTNRIALNGTAVTAFGSNVGSSSGPAHPVWWTWTAPQSGRVTLKTAGSSFDTTLHLYTGTNLADLVLLAENDNTDVLADGALTSKVVFEAVAGTPCQIQVDGHAGAVGSIRLELAYTPVPPNDAFANGSPLSGRFIAARGSNLGAGKEAEPAHAANPGGASVWWTWQAPVSGPFVLTTAGSTFDTLLAVYTGDTLPSLTPVASNNDEPSGDLGGLTSEVRFDAVAGTSYQIAVDGFNGQSGAIRLAGGYQYILTEIYPLSGNYSTAAYGLNDLGQVCGKSYANQPVRELRTAFLWENGVARNLGYLDLQGAAEALGLNNRGQVVGRAALLPPEASTGIYHAFVWEPNTGMVALDPTEDPNLPSYGAAINDAGMQCGVRWTLSTFGISYAQAFRWTPNQGVTLLDSLGGGLSTEALNLNAAGVIVGRAAVDQSNYRACLWRPGCAVINLGTLGGQTSAGWDINDLGQVVGDSTIRPGSPVSHAFLWQDGTMADLGTLQFSRDSVGTGVNTNGQIVGAAFYSSADSRATLWQDGGMIDLNRLVGPSLGWRLERATAINNRGEIVGYGSHRILKRAFLLTPFTFQMANPRFVPSSAQFQFDLVGPNGRSFRVDASTDFTNWTTVATGTFPTNSKSLLIIDNATPAAPPRFYRARLQ